jgi:hypothetical protein
LGERRSSISTKQELITYTTTAWDALVAYVDGLTAEQWSGPKDAAGWSVTDHVAHVTHWDRAVIARLRNNVPMPETLGISEPAWAAESFDPMNEEIRRVAPIDSVHKLKADRDTTWTDLVSLMGELSAEQLTHRARRPGSRLVRGPWPSRSSRCSSTTAAITMRSTSRISRPSSKAIRRRGRDNWR